MNDTQSEMLIKCMLANEEQIDSIFEALSDKFPIGAFFNRMGLFPIKFEKRLLVSLGVIYTEYGIGGLIIIGYYLEWLAVLTNQDILTTNWVYSDVWPFGIFSEETIHKFWDKQKVSARPDNLVDHPTAAASFLNQETAELPKS